MTEAEAQAFGQQWIAAWNTHDLDLILSHYADDVEVTSPLVESVLGPGRATVRGKERVREYWGKALARYPELHFRLYRAYAGPRSTVLHYQSVQGLVGAECLEFDDAGLIRRVLAHYALGPDPVAA
ncbi:MAG TPA: nuclear transport factor 2 family protein [Gemmatimonadales bacterium]|nr:nuclear transport factor 2 family protein [Gemmatimonadales bacterium]